MAKKTDEKTLLLINEIKKQKEEIGRLEKPNWFTNLNFSYTEDSAKIIPLHVESNVRNLTLIAAFLLEKQRSFEAAAAELGVESDFTWCGFSVQNWLSDIKLRVAKLQIATKRKYLESLETRLNSIISPELRAEMELDAIEAELKQTRR